VISVQVFVENKREAPENNGAHVKQNVFFLLLAPEDKWCQFASGFSVIMKCFYVEITFSLEKVVDGISIKGA